MKHNKMNIRSFLLFAKCVESVFFSEKNIKNLFTEDTWKHLEDSILFIEHPEDVPVFFKQLPPELFDKFLASDIERLTAFWRVFIKDGFVTYEDISAFSGASIPTLKRMVQSGKLKKINRVSRPAKIEFKSALSYILSEELPEDPHERETQFLWRILLTPRSEWPDHLPKVRAKNRAQLISKMFLPAYIPQAMSFHALMKLFSTPEIAFIQAILLAQRNNDKIWENRLFSPAGQCYEKVMKCIMIFCDNHPKERYQNIMDLLFPKVFECPHCRHIGIFKSKDWEDTEEKGENGKIKNQYVYTLFCGNCNADYSIKSSDIAMKYIASQSNAELLNNEYHFSDNFISEYMTASSYHKDQQVKALNLPYSEIGKAAGGVSRCSVHAPIKKLYANPLFMKVWELSENLRSQFNPHNPFPIHPLVRFLFPETFYRGISTLCDRELLNEISFPVSPATPLSVPIESYPLPH